MLVRWEMLKNRLIFRQGGMDLHVNFANNLLVLPDIPVVIDAGKPLLRSMKMESDGWWYIVRVIEDMSLENEMHEDNG